MKRIGLDFDTTSSIYIGEINKDRFVIDLFLDEDFETTFAIDREELIKLNAKIEVLLNLTK